MEFRIHTHEKGNIAEIITDTVVLNSVQDALDIMADADYSGARKIIMTKESITQDFFDLRTGLAGEVLQKFVNYQVKLAIVGNYEKFSKNFQSFIYECNNGSQFFFCGNIDDARSNLNK